MTFVTDKGTTHQDDITIPNLCGRHKMVAKCMKQKCTKSIKGRIDKFLVTVGVYNIPLSIDNQTRRHKICKDIGVKGTVNNFNLIDT